MLAPFPMTLVPPAPFPLVVAQSTTNEYVAPGVRRAIYRMETSDGPLVVHVIGVDPSEPTVRLGAVVATDRLISRGETLTAMAHRTNAIAGVNADYFDIGNTNQPLGVVVRDGTLQRTPSKRIALDVRTDRSIHFDTFAFAGSVRYGTTTIPLTSVNEWPPPGGVTLLTPAYGTVRPAAGVQLAQIVPGEDARVASRIAGAYRIAAVAPATAHAIAGAELGFGPAALALAPLPMPGDTIDIDATLTPPLEDIVTAVGGGPLLVANGASVDDPSAPAPEERDRRFPVSGALLRSGGDLLLVEVDGRSPAQSIGLTRPQFAALARGLGATSAMAFDSGGSAELVARTLGEARASVFGTPSDGEERPVGDGLFVYSDTPVGAPAQLVVRPSSIVALPGASVALRASLVDGAGHALGDVRLDDGERVRAGSAASVVTVHARGLGAQIPIDVVRSLVRLDVGSDARNPAPNSVVHIRANGYDARGRVVALGTAVRFVSDRGRVEPDGTFRTGDRDTTIVALAPGVRSSIVLHVGRHVRALPFFEAAQRFAWRYATAPPGAPGALAFTDAVSRGDWAQLTVPFDFTKNQRAAYATTDGLDLPGTPLAFAIEIASDVPGIGVRAAFVNGLGETRVLTLTKAVDWDGFATRTITLPDDLTPPVRLTSLYAVNALGPVPVRAVGMLRFRRPAATVAGTP